MPGVETTTTDFVTLRILDKTFNSFSRSARGMLCHCIQHTIDFPDDICLEFKSELTKRLASSG